MEFKQENMDTLQNKIRAVEDAHFDQLVDERLAGFDQAYRDEAFEFRGRFKAVSSLNRSLSSGLIMALTVVEDKKYWRVWGFNSFAAYLDSDEVPEFSKSKYYELKKLYSAEGPEAFDLFTGARISAKVRRLLLTSGVNVEIDGDEVIIGGERVPASDTAAFKSLIETVHEVLKECDEREAKKDAKIEKQAAQITQGEKDFRQLERNLVALSEGNPYERSLGHAIHAMLELTEAIGQLPDEQKEARGKDGIETLWAVMLQVRKAYDVEFAFTDDRPVGTQAVGLHETRGQDVRVPVESLAAQVFAADDDFGDEEEQ